MEKLRSKAMLAVAMVAVLLWGCPEDEEDEPEEPDEAYLGSTLLLTQDVFRSMPLTMDEAVQEGWIDTEECVPNMGVHAVPPEGDELEGLVALAYDVDGRITAIEFFSMEQQPTPPWEHNPDGVGEIDEELWTSHLYFRDPTDACEPTSAEDLPEDVLGDELLLTHEEFRELPLTRDEAVAEGWIDTEECVPDMGVHLVEPLDEEVDGFDHTPVVLVYDPDTGRVIGAEYESLAEKPAPPWEHNPEGREGFEEEHWAIHMYFEDPQGICP